MFLQIRPPSKIPLSFLYGFERQTLLCLHKAAKYKTKKDVNKNGSNSWGDRGVIQKSSGSLCTYLVCGVVVLLQVGMSQGLFHADALDGVKGQHAAQQVKSCIRAIKSFTWFSPHFVQ